MSESRHKRGFNSRNCRFLDKYTFYMKDFVLLELYIILVGVTKLREGLNQSCLVAGISAPAPWKLIFPKRGFLQGSILPRLEELEPKNPGQLWP